MIVGEPINAEGMTLEKWHSRSKAEQDQQRSEVVRRGKEIYESLRAEIEPGNVGRFLIIETSTGEHEIVSTREELTRRLHDMGPGWTRYILWIGYPAMYKIGGASLKPVASAIRNGN